MNKARYAALPPRVRREMETLSAYCRQSAQAGNAEELRHWRDVSDGYLQALEATGTITEAERFFFMGRDKK